MRLDVDHEVLPRLAFKSELVLDLALRSLLEGDFLSVHVVDEGIALETAESWLNFNLAAVTLTTEVELDHWNRQELGVATDVSGHWNLSIGVLLSGGIGEVLESCWWITNC